MKNVFCLTSLVWDDSNFSLFLMTPVGNFLWLFPWILLQITPRNLSSWELFLEISISLLFSIDNTIVIKWKQSLSSQSCSHYPYYLKTFFSSTQLKTKSMKKQKGFSIVFWLWINFCSNLKLFLDDLTLLLFSHFCWKHIIHSRSISFLLSFPSTETANIRANTENDELNVY